MTTIYYSDIDHKDVEKAINAMSAGIDVLHDKALVPYKSKKIFSALMAAPGLCSFGCVLVTGIMSSAGITLPPSAAQLIAMVAGMGLLAFSGLPEGVQEGVFEYNEDKPQNPIVKFKYRGPIEYLYKKKKFKKNAEKMYPLDNSLSGLSQVLQDIETVSALSNKMEYLVKEYGQESVYIKSNKEDDGSWGITLVVNNIKNGMMAYVDENAYNCTISNSLYNEIFHDDMIDFRVAERKAESFKAQMLDVKENLKLPGNAAEVIRSLPGEVG